jgi:type I restriction enzyme R subunit
MLALLSDDTQLFKQFQDNPSFKKWLEDTVFGLTYQSLGEGGPATGPSPTGEALAESRATFEVKDWLP